MLIQILGTVTIQKHPRSLGPTLNASSLNKKNHRRGLSNKITLSFFFCITTVWPWDFCLHHAYPPKNGTVPRMALEGMSLLAKVNHFQDKDFHFFTSCCFLFPCKAGTSADDAKPTSEDQAHGVRV